MYGISFNGKHSWNDFGITMGTSKELGLPSKEKILIKVPFSNTEYDFSELYGSQTYSPRHLKYEFNLVDRFGKNTAEVISTTKAMLSNWLMNSHGKQKLYDDAFPDYYFLAEVEDNMSIKENWNSGTLAVTFKAYPFMIADLPEGNDIWDTFNFELDVAQRVNFGVFYEFGTTLINPGVPDVSPEIEASSAFTITMGGRTYNVPQGKSKSLDFMLKSGENDIIINGTGNISFLFYKELI